MSLRGPKSPFLMVQNLELMDLNKEVTGLVKQFIDNDEIFLVEVNIKGKPGNQKIQVFIDGDQYVDVDECSKISRKLSDELEGKDVIEGRYIIEVSSPGADKPLKLLRQYPKHIGRELEVLTRDKKKYQGALLSVIDEEIEISIKSSKIKKELNSESLKLSHSDIEKAKVVLRF
jgi:ribosome maturation factor RimP